MNCTLVISVAKRLVPSAVRRNTVKRVVREAWRASQAGPGGKSDASRPSRDAICPPVVCLMRLKRYPGETRGSKAGSGDKRPAGPKTPAPGVAVVKRELRADADRLFKAFRHGRARFNGLSGSGGSQG